MTSRTSGFSGSRVWTNSRPLPLVTIRVGRIRRVGRLHGLQEPGLLELGLRGTDAVEDDERPRPQEDDLPGEERELPRGVGPRAVAGHVDIVARVLECQDIRDVIESPIPQPLGRIGDGAVVVRPVVGLAAVVAGDLAGRGFPARFRRVVDQDRAVGDRPQVVVHVVRRAEDRRSARRRRRVPRACRSGSARRRGAGGP